MFSVKWLPQKRVGRCRCVRDVVRGCDEVVTHAHNALQHDEYLIIAFGNISNNRASYQNQLFLSPLLHSTLLIRLLLSVYGFWKRSVSTISSLINIRKPSPEFCLLLYVFSEATDC